MSDQHKDLQKIKEKIRQAESLTESAYQQAENLDFKTRLNVNILRNRILSLIEYLEGLKIE